MNYYFKVFTRKKLFHFSLWDEKIYSLQLHLHAYQIQEEDQNGLQDFLHDYVGYYLENLTVFFFFF